MKIKILDSKIDKLELNSKILNVLKDHNLELISDIWKLTRKDLKNMGLVDNEIHDIIVKLQLNGLDLNKKKY